MEQDKRVEDKKVRFILLITQVVLWFMVMVMEMVVLIVKQINVSEHMLFLVSINLITIVTISIIGKTKRGCNQVDIHTIQEVSAMEYLNLEKGGLITILIPLNLLIGEYTLFFRLNGWSRKIIHLITGVIDLFFVVATIASGEHPYYPFVIFGGMLIGIIQSEWCYRKISEETNCWDKIDILFKKGRIWMGVILIIIEIVIRMSYPSMFMVLPLITRIFSYIILAVLPIEVIVFNCFLVKKHNGMTI